MPTGFQNEKNTIRADTKPIAIAFISEFEHVVTKIVPHHFRLLPNIAAYFFGQGAQLFASFLADLNSIAHCRYSSASVVR